jgi:Domain of unknown function (DUF6647)
MEPLLSAIVLWLSVNFDLPGIQDHPRVEFVPATKIVALRYGGFVGRLPDAGAAPGQPSVVAVYHHATRTIYLPEGWTGNSAAELSILVHEMVHHLQDIGKLKFECPQEREQLAYKAQERWLGLFGRDLLRDFELDSFTILVSTRCGY